MSIGERIRKFRQEKGWLQKELALRCHMSESAIRNYELDNRTPNEKAITTIAGALGVDPYAIAEPTLDNDLGAIHTLFRYEDLYGFIIDKIDDQLCLVPTAKNAQGADIMDRMRAWYNASERCRTGEITAAEYQAWKDSYPESEWQITKKDLDQTRKHNAEEQKK